MSSTSTITTTTTEVKKKTPNDILLHVQNRKAKLYSLQIHYHEDKEKYSIAVVVGKPGAKFQHSILRMHKNLLSACGELLETLSEREFE